MSSIEPRALRDAFGAFLTGVTVVTANDAAGNPVGFTANSFASVSLEPPLLLVCLARTSRNFETMTKAPGFAVNILSEGQKDVSNTFARPVEDRFAAVKWEKGPHGSPVFLDVAAWFDCSTESVVDGGDHVILIGRIENFENGNANGLGYARGSYFTPGLAQKALSMAGAEGEILAGAVAARDGAILLVQLADGRFSLPTFALAHGESPRVLAEKLEHDTGLPVSIGFVYSVYEDRSHGKNHIVYRGELGAGDPRTGQLFRLDQLPLDRLVDTSTRDILTRYANESRLGNFAMYVGNELSGRIHPVSGKQ
jgi:flavin reductase (DIM6/NTAB) family NADH-FMN oxidoreductase RutF